MPGHRSASFSVSDATRLAGAAGYVAVLDRGRGPGGVSTPGGSDTAGTTVWPLTITGERDGDFYPAILRPLAGVDPVAWADMGADGVVWVLPTASQSFVAGDDTFGVVIGERDGVAVLEVAGVGVGVGSGSGSANCCADGEPPGDVGECPDDPAVCVTWRTEYQHLENVAVRVGQSIRPGQLIGYTGRYFNGAHAHFGLGAGPVNITERPTFTIGQTIDIAGWLGYPTVGTRAAGTYPAAAVPFDAGQIAYIESVFAPPLAGPDWKIGYGSPAHADGEYYAVDVVPADVDFEGAPSQAMAGVPQCNAVADGADVESVVEFVGELNERVHWMVVVRHRRRCCPADPPAGGSGSGPGAGSGSGGQTDPTPGGSGPDAVPPPANRVTVATGEMCFGVGSGSGPGAGLSDALSEAIADWVLAQGANGSWDGSPFPLVARIARAAIALPQGATIEPAGCATLSDECDDLCRDADDCDPTCRTDCPEAPAGAPSRWRFFTDATVAGGLTLLDIDTDVPCAWSGRWRTTVFDQDAILYYDSGWTLASPADGTGAVYDLGLDGTFDPLTGGSLELANAGDPGIEGNYPDTLLLWPACVPEGCPAPPVTPLTCPGTSPPVACASTGVTSFYSYETVTPRGTDPAGDPGRVCIITESNGAAGIVSATNLDPTKKYQVRAKLTALPNGMVLNFNFKKNGNWSSFSGASGNILTAPLIDDTKTILVSVPAGSSVVGLGTNSDPVQSNSYCYTIELDNGEVGDDVMDLDSPFVQSVQGYVTADLVPDVIAGVNYIVNGFAIGSVSGLVTYHLKTDRAYTMSVKNTGSATATINTYSSNPLPTPGTALNTLVLTAGSTGSIPVPADGFFTVTAPIGFGAQVNMYIG